MEMHQHLVRMDILIYFGGWTFIYHLFWCSPWFARNHWTGLVWQIRGKNPLHTLVKNLICSFNWWFGGIPDPHISSIFQTKPWNIIPKIISWSAILQGGETHVSHSPFMRISGQVRSLDRFKWRNFLQASWVKQQHLGEKSCNTNQNSNKEK